MFTQLRRDHGFFFFYCHKTGSQPLSIATHLLENERTVWLSGTMATAVIAVKKEEKTSPELPVMLTNNKNTANSTTPPPAESAITANEEENEKRRLEREKLLAKRSLWYVDVASFLRVRYSCNAYWAEATDRVLEKDVEQVLSVAGQTSTYSGSQPSSKSFMLSSFGMTLQNAVGSEQPRAGATPPQTTNYLSVALKAAVQATLDASMTTKESHIGNPGATTGTKQQQQQQQQTNHLPGFSATGQDSNSTYCSLPYSTYQYTSLPSLYHYLFSVSHSLSLTHCCLSLSLFLTLLCLFLSVFCAADCRIIHRIPWQQDT